MSGNLKNQLIEGRARLGVLGCGYIGFTSLVNFANEGVSTIGYDIDHKVAESIKKGDIQIPNLDYWLGFPIKPLINNGMITATLNWKDMLAKDIRVHIIAVPTEKNGEPWNDAIIDVVGKLSKRKPTSENPDLVIVESTLAPGTLDQVVVKILEDEGWTVGQEFLVGIAPRRDWFDTPEKNLRNLPRVIGGTTQKTVEIMKAVLGIVSKNIIVAKDHRTAEMAKSVENSLLHVCAAYAMQLARAYPNVDVTEVLKLASTHWRIPLYYPSVGTGGYCVPLSTKYIKYTAPSPDLLTIAEEVIKFDQAQPLFVADLIAKHTSSNSDKIGILGITYKGDLKIHTLSPSLTIIRRLRELRYVVHVHDPYYTETEISNLVGTKTFRYPDELSNFKCILIVPAHRIYAQTPKKVLFKNLRKGQVILDNMGVWEKWRDEFRGEGIIYYRIGDKGWTSIG